jgi:hypothetical protein
MLCKWRHHPNGGGGVVFAGYTVLYVPDYARVVCISHNKQRPSCTPEENFTSLGVKSAERGGQVKRSLLLTHLCGNIKSKKRPPAVGKWGGVLSYWNRLSCHQNSLFTKSVAEHTRFCTADAIF